jgi:hypothetical protein
MFDFNNKERFQTVVELMCAEQSYIVHNSIIANSNLAFLTVYRCITCFQVTFEHIFVYTN